MQIAPYFAAGFVVVVTILWLVLGSVWPPKFGIRNSTFLTRALLNVILSLGNLLKL